MDLDEKLRFQIHEIKNLLHYTRIGIDKELLTLSKGGKIKKNVKKTEIQDLIKKVSSTQKAILSEVV